MTTFNIKIANHVIKINAFYLSTFRYCKDFISEEKEEYEITLTQEDLEKERTYNDRGDVYVSEEISATYRKIADLLIEDNILVFHGSSFMVNDKGYIITARSGTGKSTHVGLLKQLLGDKLTYINDDKPLIDVSHGCIIYSSPWNGKEHRGNNVSAPLSSVIFLERGIKNSYIELTDKSEIYIKLLSQIYLPLEKDKREKALKNIDIIRDKINFYLIKVNTDISSAEMSYERIIKDETK